jgi:hypothetical protein
MPTPTYTPLATVTLASTNSSVSFSNIPATPYRDLILVVRGAISGTANIQMRFNSDSGSNYPNVFMRGQSSGTQSNTYTPSNVQLTISAVGTGNEFTALAQIMDYSATDKHKMILNRSGYTNDIGSSVVEATAARWASTVAINSIAITTSTSTFGIGSIFSLYGVIA